MEGWNLEAIKFPKTSQPANFEVSRKLWFIRTETIFGSFDEVGLQCLFSSYF